MKRPILRKVFVFGLVLTFGALPQKVDAQIILDTGGFISGGSNFATSMSGVLSFDDGATLNDGIGHLVLTIENGGPGVFAAIGVVNVPMNDVTVTDPGTNDNGWNWEGTQQLSGDGLPETIWAWTAPPPQPTNGQPESSGPLTFTFAVSFDNFNDLADIGFGVHAIAFDDCSTKFGVWDGGSETNDVGPDNYDPACSASVPEPASSGLILVGLGGLAFVARRRRTSLLIEDGEAA